MQITPTHILMMVLSIVVGVALIYAGCLRVGDWFGCREEPSLSL